MADRLTKLALCTVDCGGAWANTLSSLPHVNIPEDPKGIIPIVPLSRFFFHLEKKFAVSSGIPDVDPPATDVVLLRDDGSVSFDPSFLKASI